MTPTSQSRLDQLHPVLKQKILTLAQMLEPEGIILEVSQGLRTWAEQDALYAQGRTAPGKIVTLARGGYSWHNFGLACDCVPETIDHQIDWDSRHPQWRRMAEAGVSLGLVSGANWVRIVDAPHFQLTGKFPVTPDDEVRRIYSESGIEAVWNAADILA